MLRVATVVAVRDESRILLGYRKSGFDGGYLRGFLGELQRNESVEQAAKRSLMEECGIAATVLTKFGVLDVVSTAPYLNPEILHLYTVSEFEGEPVETANVKPQWLPIDQIRFMDVWPIDRHWLPFYLQGKCISGSLTVKVFEIPRCM